MLYEVITLGKTWLSAFDSVKFKRVLFVAHREEILRQALATFRRIRPDACMGFYTGKDKIDDADILFASVQTLGRARHLERFAEDTFDYVITSYSIHYTKLYDRTPPAAPRLRPLPAPPPPTSATIRAGPEAAPAPRE